MSAATKKALAIKLWYGSKSAAEVAKECGFSSGQSVRNFWRLQKRSGGLPRGARPLFAVIVADAAAGDDEGIYQGGVGDIIAFNADGEAIEGAPIGGAIGLAIPPGDPLLCALRLVHGAESWRPLDLAPPSLLELERLGALVPKSMLAISVAQRDWITAALLRRYEKAA